MYPYKIQCYIIKLLILIIGTLSSVIQTYNLNVDKSIIFKYPNEYMENRESYFGYTVALYNDKYYQDQSVIVGAPRANTTDKSIIEPGGVFKCAINGNCYEWILEDTRNKYFKMGTIIRNHSWLGGSLSVENSLNPRAVVCAPRWKINWDQFWFMNGICYYAEINASQSFNQTYIEKVMTFSSKSEQTDRDVNNNGYFKYGMGLLGISLHTFSNGTEWHTILGGPGTYNAIGTTVILQRNNSQLNTYIHDFDDYTSEYLGYSVTSGKYFDSYLNLLQYAASAPRNDDLTGLVHIFLYNSLTNDTNTVDTLHGRQKGEYFGSSITSCDIDNDGNDEILVGAPTWTKNGDEGSVYIFTTKNKEKFQLSLQIDGQVKDARFGTSVVCLGDIDRDNYQDFAVGAPYENNYGAVYIFNGNKNGLPIKWSQRISGNDFSYHLRGFGISISEPRDIDGNGYNDVAIGAYLSGHAVIIKSQPVVTVNIKIIADSMKIYSNATSFSVQICGSYDGVSAPTSLNTIINLKVDPIHERIYIENLTRENRTYIQLSELSRNKSTCQKILMKLKDKNSNVIDPIEISASLELAAEIKPSSVLSNFHFDFPVINRKLSKNKDNITIEFALDCGIDNFCNSNITLDITTNLKNENHFVMGSKDGIKLFIDVHNYGEAAYLSLIHIFIPESLGLLNVLVPCLLIQNPGIHEIICNIGNPLTNQNNLTLELITRQTENIKDHIDIIVFVTTRSKNLNSNQSEKKLKIYIDTDINITLTGNAYDTSYSFYDSEKKNKLEVIKFQHVYEIRNFGITPIMQSYFTVFIPTYIINRNNKNKIVIAKIIQTDIASSEFINKQNCIQGEIDNLNYIKNDNNSNKQILYINCNNPLIICVKIFCYLQSSSNSLTIGRVTITMELQLKNFTDNIMNGTSIINFESNGHVDITLPTDIIQKSKNKSDFIYVTTTFDSSTAISSTYHIPIWIIVLSIFLGILLLALLTFGLIKLGFFNRKKREELETLKSNEDKKHSIILETTSSREILDQD